MIGTKLIVNLESITRIKEQISTEEILSKLERSKILKWLPAHIDSRNVLPQVRQNAPLAIDIVEWMQVATAGLAVLQGAAEDYSRAGSAIAVSYGDAWIPTVSTTGIYAVSTTRSDMLSRGYGQCVVEGQTFNVPAGGKTTIAGQNFLAWASIPNPGGWGGQQWAIAIMRWLELARSPINEKIRFPSVEGFVAPQFLMISTAIPTPIQQLIIGMQSDKAQKLVIKGRSAGNYTVELFNLGIDVPEGESNSIVFVRGLPIVPPYVLEMQPEDNTQTTITTVSTRPR